MKRQSSKTVADIRQVEGMNFLGYRLYAGTAERCVAEVLEHCGSRCDKVNRRAPKWLACLNPHSYAMAERDPVFSIALKHADWLIPDGIGVVWGARFLGIDIKHRITGYDIFTGTLVGLQRLGGKRVFLLGATAETLDLIQTRLASEFPRVIVCGSFSPPFKEEFNAYDLAEICDRVNTVQPDVVFVGLSAPKQEKLIDALAERIEASVLVAIGAVFDFYTGKVKRAPKSMQLVGLEWLPRLFQEPRRLWRRTFVSAPRFVLAAIRSKCRAKGSAGC